MRPVSRQSVTTLWRPWPMGLAALLATAPRTKADLRKSYNVRLCKVGRVGRPLRCRELRGFRPPTTNPESQSTYIISTLYEVLRACGPGFGGPSLAESPPIRGFAPQGRHHN